MDDGYIWSDASVTYPDWTGTAQLDQRMTAAGIEDAVGLDPNKWTAVGFEIGGGEHPHDIHVLAVPNDIVPQETGDVFPKIAEANGGFIPVTDFLIHDRDPYEILRAITHVFSLRLRARGSRDLPIRVMALGDVPSLDDLG